MIDSSRNIQSTSRRCMPIARRVPISRVRSRIAIHIVFMMPMMMIAMQDRDQDDRHPLQAPCSVQVMNEISSSQEVTSSFWPVQSSRATDWNFIQNARGSGGHHPPAGLFERGAQSRRDLRDPIEVLAIEHDLHDAGRILVELIELPQGLDRDERVPRAEQAEAVGDRDDAHVDGVVRRPGWWAPRS